MFENVCCQAWRRRSRLLIRGVMGLLLLLVGSIPSVPTALAAESLKARAALWKYETLCNFPDAPNWPTKESRSAGTSLSAEECGAVTTRLGQPPAVRVTLENTSEIEQEVPIDGLASVKVLTAGTTGKTIAALAVRRKSVGGPRYYFTTKLSGSWRVHVAPGQVVDLVFLFSEARVGDRVSVGTLATAKIE
jgi:hypothetical protein